MYAELKIEKHALREVITKSYRPGAQPSASCLARRATWLERARGLFSRWRGSLDSTLSVSSRSRLGSHCAVVRIGRALSRAWIRKALSDHPSSRICVESQKGLARVLPDEAQSASSQQAPGPHALFITVGMRRTAQCRMVDRLHVRCVVGWSTLPHVQCHRRFQSGSLGDRSGLESSGRPRHPHVGTYRGLTRLSEQASFGQRTGICPVGHGRVG